MLRYLPAAALDGLEAVWGLTMKYVEDGYTLNTAGCLVGDKLLTELWCMGFGVKLFEAHGTSNAGLESLDGEGRVPGIDMLKRFADQQARYAKELRIRNALLKQKTKGRKSR